MDKRTTSIVVTAVTTLLCACPGLCSLVFGGMFALVSLIPGADIDMMGSSDPQTALTFGLGGVCTGIVMLIIAGVVLFFTWRRTAGNSAVPPAGGSF